MECIIAAIISAAVSLGISVGATTKGKQDEKFANSLSQAEAKLLLEYNKSVSENQVAIETIGEYINKLAERSSSLANKLYNLIGRDREIMEQAINKHKLRQTQLETLRDSIKNQTLDNEKTYNRAVEAVAQERVSGREIFKRYHKDKGMQEIQKMTNKFDLPTIQESSTDIMKTIANDPNYNLDYPVNKSKGE